MTEHSTISKMPRGYTVSELYEDFDPFVGVAAASQIPMLMTDRIDEEYVVVFANDSFLELTNRTHEAVINCKLQDVLSRSFSPASCLSILRALAGRQSATWSVECQPLDGKTFLATAFTGPLRSQKSIFSHNYVAIIRQEARADHALPMANHCDEMYDNTPGFIARTEGPAHRFTYVNSAYKRFMKCDDLVGKTVSEALPGMDGQGFTRVLNQVFRTGGYYHGKDVEVVVKGSDGAPEKRYCDFVYQPIHAADGSVTGLFCEGFDVTERHEFEEQLIVLNNQVIQLSRVNAMGTMAATLAHELNQPIAAMANYAAAGLRHLNTGREGDFRSAKEAMLAIGEIAERTGDLVKNLRKLTQTGDVEKTSFEITSAISECIQLVVVGAEPSLEIIDRTEHSLMVTANRIQVQQVIINLLRNAGEASRNLDCQTLEICAERLDDRIKIRVKDCGSGVSDLALKTLFTLNETTKEDGMGIGLSVSRTIVESHGGRIWLEETGPDGSVFCFTLPADPA